MYDLIESVHKALGIESTRIFVLVVALSAALIAGVVGGVFAWIVDVGYKKSPEYKAEHPPKQQAGANNSTAESAPATTTQTVEPNKTLPSPQSKPSMWRPILKGWAGTTSSCTGVLDGVLLMKYSQKYEAGIACGFYSTIDRFKDMGISITQPYDIRPRDIEVGVGVTPAMVNAYKTIESQLPIVMVNGIPGRQVRIWYEVFLMPKRMGIGNIHKLDDIEDAGGKLLSGEAKSVEVTTKIPTPQQ